MSAPKLVCVATAFALASAACEQTVTPPPDGEGPLFSHTASCDSVWEIWRGDAEHCDYPLYHLQEMHDSAWCAEADMYDEHAIVADTSTGFRYWSESYWDYLPVAPDWVDSSSVNAGYYLDPNGTGPYLEEAEPNGIWTTIITAGACVAAVDVAIGAHQRMEQALNKYQSNPTQENAQTLSNLARIARGSALVAAYACGRMLVSLGSPI